METTKPTRFIRPLFKVILPDNNYHGKGVFSGAIKMCCIEFHGYTFEE